MISSERPRAIALTGAGGMVGSAVAAALSGSGHRMILLRHGSADAARSFAGGESRRLPDPDAPEHAFRDALAGAEAVVHCAAINTDRADADPARLMAVNGQLTARLAEAAARVGIRRFLYTSSIRAVAGPEWQGLVDDATPELPGCPYGRSKLAGEHGVRVAFAAASEGSAAILRLAPVYGAGMRGNLAGLLRLADTPLPLPLGAVGGRRSLLGLHTVPAAIAALLQRGGGPPVATYVVSDAAPVSVREIVEAFREGLGRPGRMMSVPPPALGALAALLGKRGAYRRLLASQVCDPSPLRVRGWSPEPDTRLALRRLAREGLPMTLEQSRTTAG